MRKLILEFIKRMGRKPNAVEMLKLKFKASSMKEGQILKPDFGKGDPKGWMDRVSDAFVKSTKAKNKEAAYNMALKRYESVDRKFLPQKQIENIYRDLAKDSRGREIILRDIGEIEKREMFTTMSNQMKQDLISKLRKLSLGPTKPRQPNPFKNKPTGKKDPNFDPDPTGMASGGRIGLSNGGPIDPSNYGIFPQIPGGLPFPDLDSYDSDYKKLIKKKKEKKPSDFDPHLDRLRQLPKGDFVEKKPSDFDPHLEDLIDLLYREKDKNKFKIEKAPYVYDEDDLPWWMEPYRENDPIDVGPAEIKVAQGGRVPLAWGGILKLLKFFKKKPETLKEFIDRRNFLKLMIGNTDKMKNKRRLKEILEENKNVKGFEFPESGVGSDFHKELEMILSKGVTKQASGGLAGQLHLNQGGRVGLQTGGPLSEQDFYNSYWGAPSSMLDGYTGTDEIVYFKKSTPEQLALRDKNNYTDLSIYDRYYGPTDYQTYLSNYTPVTQSQTGRIVPSIQGAGKYDFINEDGVPTAISEDQVEMMLNSRGTTPVTQSQTGDASIAEQIAAQDRAAATGDNSLSEAIRTAGKILDPGKVASTAGKGMTTIYHGTTAADPFAGKKFFVSPEKATAAQYAKSGIAHGNPLSKAPVTGRILETKVPTSQLESQLKRGLTGTREAVLDPKAAKALFEAGEGTLKGSSSLGTRAAVKAARAIPVAGTGLALADAAARAKQGDYVGAGLGAASALPVAGIPFLGAQMAYDQRDKIAPYIKKFGSALGDKMASLRERRGVDPRMAATYEQNRQVLGDPRMSQASGGLAKILGA